MYENSQINIGQIVKFVLQQTNNNQDHNIQGNETEMISYIQNLKEFKINTQIYLNNVELLPPAVKLMSSLQKFSMVFQEHSKDQCPDIEQLFENFKQLKDLQSLSMHFKKSKESCLHSFDLNTIIYGMMNIQNLKSLEMQFEEQQLYYFKSQMYNLGQEISNFVNLSCLNLQFGDQTIEESGILSIGRAVQGMKKLTILKLNFPYCRLNSIIDISDGYKRLQNLIILELYFPKYPLDANSFSEIQQSFKKLLKVEKLSLSICVVYKVDIQDLQSLIRNIGNMQQLQDLLLQIRGIKHDSNIGIEIIEALKKTIHLKHLNLKIHQQKKESTFNHQGNETSQQEINDILLLKNLEILEINVDSEQHLGIGGLKSFGKRLTNSQILKEFTFVYHGINQTQQDNFLELAQGLQQLKNLNKIVFKIKNKNYETVRFNVLNVLGESIQSLINLNSLELTFNNIWIEPQDGLILSQMLKNAKNLDTFKLKIHDQCNLGQEGVMALYESLKHLNNLQMLELNFEDDYAANLFRLVQDLNLNDFQLSEKEHFLFKRCKLNDNQLYVTEFYIECKELNKTIKLQGIFNSLQYFTNLQKLTINTKHYNFTLSELQYLMGGIALLEKITFLKISLNMYKKQLIEISKMIIQSLNKIKNLRILKLDCYSDQLFKAKQLFWKQLRRTVQIDID